MEVKQRVLLAASVAGLLAGFSAGAAHAHEGDASGKVPCYGINKCKGTGACGGAGHSCHGANECKAQGYLLIEKDTCLNIEGGRLTEQPEPAA